MLNRDKYASFALIGSVDRCRRSSLLLVTLRESRFTVRHRRWHAASVALVAWALVAVAACSAASPGASEPRKAGAQPAAFAATGTARAHGSASPANSSPAAISGPIVALGDSYTAGDMLPLDLTASPLGCLRSTRSYPVLVARAMRDTRGLTDVACNGAGWKAMTAAEHT